MFIALSVGVSRASLVFHLVMKASRVATDRTAAKKKKKKEKKMATNHQFSVGNKPKRKGDQKANADELPGDAVRRCCSDDGGCVVADVPTKAKKKK